MPTPRTRQSTASPQWPALSLVAIYSAQPLLDERDPRSQEPRTKLSDEELEAAKVIYFWSASAPDARPHEIDPDRKRKMMNTVMGVADFAKMMTTKGSDDRIRSVKTSKRRMVWIEPEPGIFVHATVTLPRVCRRHSRQTSTATNSSSRSIPVEGATVPLDDQVLTSSLAYAYDAFRLEKGRITRCLAGKGKAETMEIVGNFWRGWIRNWDLAKLASEARAIEQVLGGVPMSPRLDKQISSQFDPLLAQFAASNPASLPILLLSNHALHLPEDRLPSSDAEGRSTSPPPLANDEIGNLTRYLASLASLRIAAELALDRQASADLASGSAVVDLPSGAASPSNWTSSALSYLDPRNISLPSLTSISPVGPSADLRRDFQALRAETRNQRAELHHRRSESVASTSSAGSRRPKKEGLDGRGTPPVNGSNGSKAGGSSVWGLRSVSKGWSKLGSAFMGGSGTGSASDAEEPRDPILEADAQRKDPKIVNDAQPEASLGSSSATDAAQLDPTRDQQTSVSTSPSTPGVDLAPDVSEAALLEALSGNDIEDERRQLVEEQFTSAQTEAESQEREKVAQDTQENGGVLRLVAGDEDEPFEVRLFERGLLTLALATRPVDASDPSFDVEVLSIRAARLLEAIEAVLEYSKAPAAPSSTGPRFLIKSGSIVQAYSNSPLLPIATNVEVAREAELETATAFLEARRALSSPLGVVESLTRLPTSTNWFSISRSTREETVDSTLSTTSRSADDPVEELVDIVALLPAKSSRGRETTLVEAAEGARRIEKKWLATGSR
ncbi:hypothetical protein JCM10212_004843 [Sporobolomyces blumeae]